MRFFLSLFIWVSLVPFFSVAHGQTDVKNFSNPPKVIPQVVDRRIVIVALGDSLTEGYGLSKEDSYPTRLEEKLRHDYPELKIINAGISGSTSASGESRLKWQLKNKPHILFLALGANDGLRGLGTEALKSNLEKTIQLAQQNGVYVVLAGMKIPMNYGAEYRQQYEMVFSDLAKKYKLDFVPFLLDGVATKKDLNLADGIHPNAEGYKIISEKLAPVFKQVILKMKTQKGTSI